jgi:hypothetical protein
MNWIATSSKNKIIKVITMKLNKNILTNNEIMKLIQATGLRRNELENLKTTDFQYDTEKQELYVLIHDRTTRKALILPSMTTEILKLIEYVESINGKGAKLVIEIPKMNIQDARSIYVKSVFTHFAQELKEQGIENIEDITIEQIKKMIGNNKTYIVKKYLQ